MQRTGVGLNLVANLALLCLTLSAAPFSTNVFAQSLSPSSPAKEFIHFANKALAGNAAPVAEAVNELPQTSYGCPESFMTQCHNRNHT
jgi:hypothetical protein